MAKYSLTKNHAKEYTLFYKSKKFIIIALILILMVGLGFWIAKFLQSQNSNNSPNSTAISSSTIASSTQIFTTSYFQFQTTKDWSYIANESSGTKFVYRRGSSNLVSGEIIIYINSSPTDTQATRVLPVSLSDDKFTLKASFTSEHCKTKLPKEQQNNTGEALMTLNTVKFLCDVDGNLFTVVVGLENDTSVMKLARPDGTTANYMIYFKDLRFKAEPKEFETIMNSFQVR